jgi:acyl dehydratase
MELRPGAVAVMRRTFTQDDFDRFAALSGDDNPIHVDPEFAARTRFGRTVCHGMLLYSTICAALSCEIGPGYAQGEQELMFVTPTYTGEEVEVRLEIGEIWTDRGLAGVNTLITRPDGSIACQGRTLVALPGAPLGALAGRLKGKETVGPAAGAGAASHKGLVVGQVAMVERVFTPADVAEYVALTGDSNPAYAASAADKEGLQVPNGLLGGLFSYLLGTRLPGRGTNWLKQRLVFPAPAAAGDHITSGVEIVRLRPDKDLVNLRTICSLDYGRPVCHGEALVLVKDLESA